MGARRFVAIGNLLGYQTKSLFPTTTGRDYEKTTLLEPVLILLVGLVVGFIIFAMLLPIFQIGQGLR